MTMRILALRLAYVRGPTFCGMWRRHDGLRTGNLNSEAAHGSGVGFACRFPCMSRAQ